MLFTKFDEKEVIAKIKEEAKEQEKRRKEEEKLQKEADKKAQKEGAKLEEITIDYLDKVNLKVAKILSCEKVEGS